MASNKVLAIGVGDLGGWVVEFLARVTGIQEIIVADIDEDKGFRKTNLACIGAAQMGFYPRMRFQRLDLNNIEETAQVLRTIQADVIFNCTTLQSWWVLHTMRKEIADKIRDGAGLGPWTPMHAALTYKLMKAIRTADLHPVVINGAFPDATNVMLSKAGLAPDLGMGNVENLIPRIQRAVSLKLDLPMKNIQVFMVGHHFHVISILTTGSTGGAPYYLKVIAEGSDLGGVLSDEDIFGSIRKAVAAPSGSDSHPIVAASAVRNITAVALNNDDIFHSPGPLGLPGCYPIRFENGKPKVILPSDLSLKKAVEINTQAQKFDGIETIDDRGALVLTDKALEIMSHYLNYKRKRVALEEIEDAATELRSKFLEAAKKNPKE